MLTSANWLMRKMKCKCYMDNKNYIGRIGICLGTREKEPCSCCGDENKCDFYEEVRKRARGQWISVRDKLPEPFVSVLVYMPLENPFETVREGFITKNGTWHAALNDRDPDEVTHWREMPAPPDEGGLLKT